MYRYTMYEYGRIRRICFIQKTQLVLFNYVFSGNLVADKTNTFAMYSQWTKLIRINVDELIWLESLRLKLQIETQLVKFNVNIQRLHLCIDAFEFENKTYLFQNYVIRFVNIYAPTLNVQKIGSNQTIRTKKMNTLVQVQTKYLVEPTEANQNVMFYFFTYGYTYTLNLYLNDKNSI